LEAGAATAGVGFLAGMVASALSGALKGGLVRAMVQVLVLFRSWCWSICEPELRCTLGASDAPSDASTRRIFREISIKQSIYFPQSLIEMFSRRDEKDAST
jgi:hypothetical protein